MKSEEKEKNEKEKDALAGIGSSKKRGLISSVNYAAARPRVTSADDGLGLLSQGSLVAFAREVSLKK